MRVDVGIVGAGLAGLCCARRAHELGLSVLVVDAAERVGGRVVTDEHEGFLLDRGFQVLLDAYPEARAQLDLQALAPRPFSPGALVRKNGSFWRVVDPWRRPLQGLMTLRAPFVSLSDGPRMARLRRRALAGEVPPAGPTADFLAACGFSSGLRESFFAPFFGGVTLDSELQTPATHFLSLFGYFARGSAVLPAKGMRAIPEQLAQVLPAEALRLGTRVTRVSPTQLELAGGEVVECGVTVVAADASGAEQLGALESAPAWSGTTTLYYAAEASPVGEPILVLNGEGPAAGPVNHLCVLSDAQPSYAPEGAALISVSVLGVPKETDEELDRAVRAQLGEWYGAPVGTWRLLRIDRIPHALPHPRSRPSDTLREAGLLVCGDHVATPSIQGSMRSGRMTAEAARDALAS